MTDCKENDALWNEAVREGPGSDSYDTARKLTALALAEDNPEMSGEEAASHSDRGWFRKAIDFAVGLGNMNAEDAVQGLIDRAHATAAAFIKRTLPTAVRVGCTWVGRTVGALFGPTGIAVGNAVGTWLGNVLNEDVKELALKGLDMVRQVAHSLWDKAKAFLVEKGRAIAQNIVNSVIA